MQDKKALAEKALEHGYRDHFVDLEKGLNFIRMIILFWVREVELMKGGFHLPHGLRMDRIHRKMKASATL